MLTKSQLEDAIRCRSELCYTDECSLKWKCMEWGANELRRNIAETAIHYLTLSERQAKVLEMAKEALVIPFGIFDTNNKVHITAEKMLDKAREAITAIERVSDNG